jgi:hypothetical protein
MFDLLRGNLLVELFEITIALSSVWIIRPRLCAAYRAGNHLEHARAARSAQRSTTYIDANTKNSSVSNPVRLGGQRKS